jgi:hypothetical protein
MKIRNAVGVDHGGIHNATKIELKQTFHDNSDGKTKFQLIAVKIIEVNNETAVEHKFNIFSNDEEGIEVDLQGQFELTLTNKED